VGDLKKPSISFLEEKEKTLGVAGVGIISPKSVATAAWVRLKCRFGCARFNTSHCCPPNTPTPQQMREVLDCYTRAVLVHCKGETGVTAVVTELEREAFLNGFYKALGLGAGPCRLCKECNPAGNCMHPAKARPSMEACGIDVYATARANGFPIEVLKDQSCEPNRYGLVLVD